MNENPQPEELDSGNEADTELEVEEECMWELNPLITSINRLNVNNTAHDVGEWYINEELNLAYFLCLLLIQCRQTLVPRWIMTPGRQWIL